ncbi:MAG: beta-glucosidase BglX [Lewinellaceae bacterium]|nr:beta-glucosidase BglX [Lewinellaceae bacterium]
MTLEEKIGQLTLFTSDWEVTGPTMRENYKEDILAGKVGAIFNAHTAAYTRELQRMAVEETRLGIPLLFGYDVIHGYKTIFPVPLGEAASWDLGAIQQSARVAAAEASAAGLHWTFAPMVDIARDPRWGRVMEGAGEDPYLGSAIARARVEGFQGTDLTATNTILACAKHFAAYGAAQAGRDYHTVDMSERVLREVYLPPFHAALQAGARTFMTSFNELFGVPASGSSFLLRQVLRDEWGFEGFVVTDYTSINEMVDHGVVANEAEAGELAIRAGVDMDMQGAVFYQYLLDQVRNGQVSVTLVDDAVRRILRVKFELGLFEDPYRYSDEERQKATLLSPANRAASREVARKSIVLLKNEGEVLPLSTTLRRVAVIGPLADGRQELIGAWSGAGDYRDCVTLLEGIQARLPKPGTVNYVPGCSIGGADRGGFAAAVKAARQADVVVVGLGEAAQMSGEAASRSDIRLPGVQEELLQALAATGKPIVVVLMNGRPLDLSAVAPNASSILETWYLGTEAGNAIADVLFGDYNPAGKLPITFPRNVGQVPIYYGMKNTGRPFEAQDKYTSKYLDVANEPLFPFGYGLSYTTFAYSNLQVQPAVFTPDEPVSIKVRVQNTGKRAGEEVVQLYVRDRVGSVTRPVRELKGFQKVMLQPGESREVAFTLTEADVQFYTRSMRLEAEPGDFDIYVGGDSQATLQALLTLRK